MLQIPVNRIGMDGGAYPARGFRRHDNPIEQFAARRYEVGDGAAVKGNERQVQYGAIRGGIKVERGIADGSEAEIIDMTRTQWRQAIGINAGGIIVFVYRIGIVFIVARPVPIVRDGGILPGRDVSRT